MYHLGNYVKNEVNFIEKKNCELWIHNNTIPTY